MVSSETKVIKRKQALPQAPITGAKSALRDLDDLNGAILIMDSVSRFGILEYPLPFTFRFDIYFCRSCSFLSSLAPVQ